MGTVLTRLPPARLAWLVWGLGAALYLMAFYQRVAPAVITQELSREFRLSAAALGNLSAFYFYGYVAAQIPTGILADRWGPRKLLTAGAVLTALGTFLFAFAGNTGLASAGRFVIGAGSGVAFVSMLKLATHWMPARQFAFLSGAALLIGVTGATFAGAPLRLAVDGFGWRGVMAASALLTVAIAVAIWIVVRDDPTERGYASHYAGHGSPRPAASPWADLRAVLGYRNPCLVFIASGGFSGLMLSFAGLWGVPFLVMQHGFTTPQAAMLASAMLIAWSLSTLAYSVFSEKIRRRKPLFIGGLIATLCIWAVIVFVPALERSVLIALLLALGIAAGGFVLTFAFVKESVPPHLAGTASGIANMGVMVGGMVMQPLMGLVLDLNWDGTVANGARFYEPLAWERAFSLVFAWGAVALVALSATRETHCRQQN